MTLFLDHPGEPVPEEIFWTCMVQGKITEGRHSDHPAGRHSIRSNQRPTSVISPFLCQIPFLPQPSHFILVGTGNKYAGLDTQWRGVVNDPKYLDMQNTKKTNAKNLQSV